MNHPSLFHFALHHASVANKLPYWLTYNQLNDWGKEHDMPVFASESFPTGGNIIKKKENEQ